MDAPAVRNSTPFVDIESLPVGTRETIRRMIFRKERDSLRNSLSKLFAKMAQKIRVF